MTSKEQPKKEAREVRLKNDIGEELWSKLTKEQKELMLATAGVIDFGHLIDLERVAETMSDGHQ